MKAYPSISTEVDFSLRYHVFDKLDGSNIRAEWSLKRGFHKFGSRTQLLTPDQAGLWPSVAAIQALEPCLAPVLALLRVPRAICFFEWAGPQSFAGSHHDAPAEMTLSLLDVAPYQKGLLPPERVLEIANAAQVSTPALLHVGRIDQALLDAVRAGALPGMTFEGIIGKGPFLQSAGGPVMFKHKSQAWLAKLREVCGSDTALFTRLS